MKNNKKSVLISLGIFIIGTIGMTCLFILFDSLIELNLKNITKIVTQVGVVGGTVFTSIFILTYFLIKKIKNIWLLTSSFIVLLIFIIFLAYWFFLAMIYFSLEDSKSFLSILFQIV
jgi:hypothetical protein